MIPLKEDTMLSEAAQNHSNFMAVNNIFSHYENKNEPYFTTQKLKNLITIIDKNKIKLTIKIVGKSYKSYIKLIFQDGDSFYIKIN